MLPSAHRHARQMFQGEPSEAPNIVNSLMMIDESVYPAAKGFSLLLWYNIIFKHIYYIRTWSPPFSAKHLAQLQRLAKSGCTKAMAMEDFRWSLASISTSYQSCWSDVLSNKLCQVQNPLRWARNTSEAAEARNNKTGSRSFLARKGASLAVDGCRIYLIVKRLTTDVLVEKKHQAIVGVNS